MNLWRLILRILGRSAPTSASGASGAEPPLTGPGSSQPETAATGQTPVVFNPPPQRRISVVGSLLRGPVEPLSSPNIGGVLHNPTVVVMHYTANGSFDGAVKALTSTEPGKRVSAHILIGRDGKIAQLVPFNRVAWHAGESSWHGVPSVNLYSIGIEMVNWGKLTRSAMGHWQSWTRQRIDDYVWYGGEEAWQVYPLAQVRAAVEVVTALCLAYPIDYVLGHSQVAPDRKQDPGPAFPMSRLRAVRLSA